MCLLLQSLTKTDVVTKLLSNHNLSSTLKVALPGLGKCFLYGVFGGTIKIKVIFRNHGSQFAIFIRPAGFFKHGSDFTTYKQEDVSSGQ